MPNESMHTINILAAKEKWGTKILYSFYPQGGKIGRASTSYIPEIKVIKSHKIRMPIIAVLKTWSQLPLMSTSVWKVEWGEDRSFSLLDSALSSTLISSLVGTLGLLRTEQFVHVHGPPRYIGTVWMYSLRTFWYDSPTIINFCRVTGFKTWNKRHIPRLLWWERVRTRSIKQIRLTRSYLAYIRIHPVRRKLAGISEW